MSSQHQIIVEATGGSGHHGIGIAAGTIYAVLATLIPEDVLSYALKVALAIPLGLATGLATAAGAAAWRRLSAGPRVK